MGFTLVGILTCSLKNWFHFGGNPSLLVENFGVAFALPPNIGKTYVVILNNNADSLKYFSLLIIDTRNVTA